MITKVQVIAGEVHVSAYPLPGRWPTNWKFPEGVAYGCAGCWTAMGEWPPPRRMCPRCVAVTEAREAFDARHRR